MLHHPPAFCDNSCGEKCIKKSKFYQGYGTEPSVFDCVTMCGCGDRLEKLEFDDHGKLALFGEE